MQSLVLRPSVPLNVGAGAGASLPGVVFTGEVRYASRTQRPTVGRTSHLWQVAKQTEDGAVGPAGCGCNARRLEYVLAAHDCRASGVDHRLPPVLASLPACSIERASNRLGAPRLDVVRASGWHASRIGSTGLVPERRPPARRHALSSSRTATAPSARDGCSPWQTARLLTQRQGVIFQARPDREGLAWPVSGCRATAAGDQHLGDPQTARATPCYTPSALLFAALAPADSHLLFVCENHIDPPPPDGEPVVVPVRRVYFVINNVTLHRLPDGLPVPVFNLHFRSTPRPGRGASMRCPPPQKPGRPGNGGPVELVASVNGTPFRVLAEHQPRACVRRREHPHLGRGRNAVLAAPYAPVMTFSNAGAHGAAADGRRAHAQRHPAGLGHRLGPDGLERPGRGVRPAGNVDRGLVAVAASAVGAT